MNPHPRSSTRRALAVFTALALTATGVAAAGPAFADDAVDGARTAGDPMFPGVGNGGYDALHYDVNLTWKPTGTTTDARPVLTGEITNAATTMTATAEAPLRTFSLDFEGMTVDAVYVNGDEAAWTREIDDDAKTYKLIVTPTTPVSGEFTTRVTYHGEPSRHVDTDGAYEGWNGTNDGAILLGQPIGSMAGYPHNNTPADKATYDFDITIPSVLNNTAGVQGKAAVAGNGELAGSTPSWDGRTTTWSWRQRKPMASELAVIAIGQFEVIKSEFALSDGRTIPSWSFLDSGLSDADKTTARTRIAQIGDITRNLEQLYGAYPGNSTGAIVDTVPSGVNYALETQDRSFFPSVRSLNGNTLIHELIHQWYGNNVSPTTWTDIWIGEGMASWGPTHYNSAQGFGSGAPTEQSYYNSWNTSPADSPNWAVAPGAQTDSSVLYEYQTYTRAAQFWEVLKITMGDEPFFALLKEWQSRYAGQSRTTADLKALAEELSGTDLTAIWNDWILETGKPAWPSRATGSLTATADRTPAERGDQVTYTLTASNPGYLPLDPATVTVDVADLLQQATLGDLPDGVTLDGTTLTWNTPLDAQASAEVSFTATVNADASGGSLDVTATPLATVTACDACTTSTEVAQYTYDKGPKPVITGAAHPGETLTATTDGWPEGTTFAYEWSVGGKKTIGTDATVVLPNSANGKTVTVTVTATAPGYLPTTVTSDPTTKVLPAQAKKG